MAYKHKNTNAAGMMAASPMFITPSVTVKGGKAKINREDSLKLSQTTSDINKNKKKTDYSEPYSFGRTDSQGQREYFQLFNTNYGRNFPVKATNPNFNVVKNSKGQQLTYTGIPRAQWKMPTEADNQKLEDDARAKGYIPPSERKPKSVNKPNPTNNKPNPTNKKTKSVKTTTKSTASTSIKPMEGTTSLGGDAMRASISDNISKVKATVDAARSTSNDLIKNTTNGGGRVGRVRRRQEARTARVTERLRNRRNKPQERAQVKNIRQTERTNRQMQRDKNNSTNLVPTKSASTIKNTSSQPQARLEKQTPAPVIDKPIKVRKLKDTSRYGGGLIDRSSAALDQKARAASDVSFGNEVVGAKNMTYSQPSKPSKSKKPSNKNIIQSLKSVSDIKGL